jgi:hypothetical protein
MLKSRINKFIFQEGRVFLRLKTMAKDLKIVKVGLNYAIHFSTQHVEGKKANVPVEFVEEIVLPNTNSTLSAFDWGEFVLQKDPNDHPDVCFFLKPKDQKFGVKIGPISCEINSSELEVDWENLQWGVEKVEETDTVVATEKVEKA